MIVVSFLISELSHINENSDSVIIKIPATSTRMFVNFNKKVLLWKKLNDRIIPKIQSSKEIKDIVYRPFRNSGK